MIQIFHVFVLALKTPDSYRYNLRQTDNLFLTRHDYIHQLLILLNLPVDKALKKETLK